MRKTLLTTVSVLALGLGSAAFADDATSTTGVDSQTQVETGADVTTDMDSGADIDMNTGVNAETGADVDTGLGSVEVETDSTSTMSALGAYSADELIDSPVVGADGEEIAEVSDLVIDDNNQVLDVLVDVGGFLGIGSKVVALDPDSLQVSQDTDGDIVIATNMTQEQLESMASYEADSDTRLQSQTY